jgi:hypothetical protein
MKKFLIVLSVFVLVIGCPTGGSSGGGNNSGNQYDNSSLWPAELLLKSFVNDISGASFSFSNYDSGNIKRDTCRAIYSGTGNVPSGKYSAGYTLISIVGKKIIVKCHDDRGSDPSIILNKEYTLCTDYSFNGTTLTFTGGDVPGVSDLVWTVRNI